MIDPKNGNPANRVLEYGKHYEMLLDLTDVAVSQDRAKSQISFNRWNNTEVIKWFVLWMYHYQNTFTIYINMDRNSHSYSFSI